MPRFDLSPAELRNYRPEVAEPADFDEFWAMTLAEHRPAADPVLTPVAAGLSLVDVYDVTFAGFEGHPIKAWLLLPKDVSTPLAGVVEYVGYGGGRGLPHERLAWVNAGYAYLLMDTRGQGSVWGSGGDTPDPVGAAPSAPGFMTRGIESPETYYYRRVFTDAVAAVEVMRGLPQVDPEKVAVTGGSQGGGITIAVAGLVGGLVAAMPDVPFLCHYERAVGLTDRDPYNEIVRYLAVHRGAEQGVFQTLSYFDGVNFARRATAPALFSVGHLDLTCPPSTVFAAYHHWAGAPSEIVEYSYNDHEGGGQLHWVKQAGWLGARV
ncbi:MAG: acetylxylan esterase [Propionicimonas sp.]|uniref:acetylxylan esterase n=1 Tax=Propionicimonas sp. TaxID=1955623 RepID=UPI002B21ADD0|nr:acetylxylan esterase [Propionicimonas sp.]MEA4943977.1 acetylxylan esterase [Propionicimonas sp.]MEA5053780.1 acetylxylan esterase [Propionicimonas sp.]MEA5118862.1 acetylxylan esterase [Propionicimonas sp.]